MFFQYQANYTPIVSVIHYTRLDANESKRDVFRSDFTCLSLPLTRLTFCKKWTSA
jgi:hypothetical protein